MTPLTAEIAENSDFDSLRQAKRQKEEDHKVTVSLSIRPGAFGTLQAPAQTPFHNRKRSAKIPWFVL